MDYFRSSNLLNFYQAMFSSLGLLTRLEKPL
jgi:hypothetical protein